MNWLAAVDKVCLTTVLLTLIICFTRIVLAYNERRKEAETHAHFQHLKEMELEAKKS